MRNEAAISAASELASGPQAVAPLVSMDASLRARNWKQTRDCPNVQAKKSRKMRWSKEQSQKKSKNGLDKKSRFARYSPTRQFLPSP